MDIDPPVAVSQDNIDAVGTGTNVFVYDAIGRYLADRRALHLLIE